MGLDETGCGRQDCHGPSRGVEAADAGSLGERSTGTEAARPAAGDGRGTAAAPNRVLTVNLRDVANAAKNQYCFVDPKFE